MSFLRKLFIGLKGVRAGWRFLAFLVILIACQAVLTLVTLPIRSGSTAFWEPQKAYSDEIVFLISVLAATLSMAELEKRKFTSYGLPSGGAGAVVEGLVWGTAAITLLVGTIWLLHGYDPGSLNARGTELVKYLILWGIFMVMVGFTEELAFRGYPLFASGQGWAFGLQRSRFHSCLAPLISTRPVKTGMTSSTSFSLVFFFATRFGALGRYGLQSVFTPHLISSRCTYTRRRMVVRRCRAGC